MFRAIALVLAASSAAGAADRAVAGVDPRVELFSIVFRLAGNPEYNAGRLPAYTAAVDSWFAPHRNHLAIQIARDLARRNGISYDAVASLSIHVTDTETLAERVPFDQPGIALDSRWRPADARRLLIATRSFVAQSRFAEFLESQRSLIDATNERVRQAVAKLDFEWFERFYGPHSFRFHTVAALLNGPNGYGPRMFDPASTGEIYCLIGVTRADADGVPDLGNPISLLVHEFSHSFVNPLIDSYYSQIDTAGSRLFEATRDQMRAQAYGNGSTVLKESLVRAATARYAYEHDGPAPADQSIAYEVSRAFLWTGEFSVVLSEYERDRERFPTLDSYMQRVCDFFHEAARAPGEMVGRYEARRPTVTEVSIANGTSDVDPGTTEIVVRFSRPMLRRASVAPRAPDYFPQIADATFDETATVCTIAVKLDPEREYELSLNSPTAGWFASEEGVSLKPYTIFFRTRALE